ncbi:hypothetical protein [Tamlana crocina]|uniref:Uncharacterized protein n=1 Tax=Tamlana crocina TaxID=393006 RepID=A0ABX1D8H3_9FLAO|nr:hypothetical protein [Tamlana crocina]NJX14670.1 hypothetical protein [Tamlana crocina]
MKKFILALLYTGLTFAQIPLSERCNEPVGNFQNPNGNGWVLISQPTFDLTINKNEVFYGTLGVDISFNEFQKKYRYNGKLYGPESYNYRINSTKPKGDETKFSGKLICNINKQKFVENVSFSTYEFRTGWIERTHILLKKGDKNSIFFQELNENPNDLNPCKACSLHLKISVYTNQFAENNINEKTQKNDTALKENPATVDNSIMDNSSKQNDSQNKTYKKPYEYSKQEWDTMSKKEQQASLQYQMDNILEGSSDTQESKIDTQLQTKAYQLAGQGDYASAMQTFSAAGDHTSALAAGGIAIIDSWSKAAEERKMRKISEREQNLRATLNDISLLRKEATQLFYSNQIDEYFEKELAIRDKELFAIFQALMLSRKSKSIQDKNFVVELENDFKEKTDFLIKSDFLSSYQKLNLFFSNSFFFDDTSSIDILKKEFIKLDDKTKQSLVIKCIQHYDYLRYDKNHYLAELKLSAYGYPTENLTEYKSKHDLKLLLALESSLDYHFYIKPILQVEVMLWTNLQKMSFKDYIYKFNMRSSKKHLKNQIKKDKTETGKSYDELLKEKN